MSNNKITKEELLAKLDAFLAEEEAPKNEAKKTREDEDFERLEALETAAAWAEMNAERLDDADLSGEHERERASALREEYATLAKDNGLNLSGDPEADLH